MQPFAKQQNVFGRIIGVTEVREKEPRGFTFEDCGEGRIPDPEIDVRRWSGGRAQKSPPASDPPGIPQAADPLPDTKNTEGPRDRAPRGHAATPPRANT